MVLIRVEGELLVVGNLRSAALERYIGGRLAEVIPPENIPEFLRPEVDRAERYQAPLPFRLAISYPI